MSDYIKRRDLNAKLWENDLISPIDYGDAEQAFAAGHDHCFTKDARVLALAEALSKLSKVKKWDWIDHSPMQNANLIEHCATEALAAYEQARRELEGK